MAFEQQDNNPLMTPAEVAQLLRVPVSTLAVWRCTQRVKLAYVKIGHAVRYHRSDVDGLIGGGRHEAH